MADTNDMAPMQGFDYDNIKAKFFKGMVKSGPHYVCLYRTEYNRMIKTLLEDDCKLSSYEVLNENGKQYLIRLRKGSTDEVWRYMPVEDLFDAIVKCHLTNNHLKRAPLREIIKSKYAGFVIPIRNIDLVVKLCNVCQITKKSNNKKKVIKKVEDRICQKVNETVFIIIHDMKPDNDGQFRYILLYKDSYSAFVFLRPLIEKDSFEVASEIAKIFLSFGVPQKLVVNPLEFDFYADILNNVNQLCGDTGVVLEKSWPKNTWCGQIVNQLFNWMTVTGSKRWGLGCHILQLQLNQKIQFVASNFTTPYQCMFKKSREDVSRDKHEQDKQSEMVPEEVRQPINLIDDDDDNDNNTLSVKAGNVSSPNNMIVDTTLNRDQQNLQGQQKLIDDTNILSYVISENDLDATVRLGLQTEQYDSAQLVKDICDEYNISITENATDTKDIVVAHDKKNQQEESVSAKTTCNVCQTLIYKLFVCKVCLKPVHLYCSVRSKKNNGSEWDLVCFNCVRS